MTTFGIDTGPATMSFTLEPASDSGLSNTDGITNDTSPVFDVTVNKIGRVSLDFNGDGKIDTTQFLASPGTYAFPCNVSLSDGVYAAKATFLPAIDTLSNDGSIFWQWTSGGGEWPPISSGPDEEHYFLGAAEAAAEARGGHLATITSAAEDDFVYNTVVAPDFTPVDNQGPWIGGYWDNSAYHVWKWVTGESFGSYTNWFPGEPDYLIGDNAIAYSSLLSGLPGRWIDNIDTGSFPNWNAYGYVIEWDSPPPGQSAVVASTNFVIDTHGPTLAPGAATADAPWSSYPLHFNEAIDPATLTVGGNAVRLLDGNGNPVAIASITGSGADYTVSFPPQTAAGTTSLRSVRTSPILPAT